MNKKALVVIDMQKDYLREGRKEMFSYDPDTLTNAVNSSIAEYAAQGCDIIYIRQVFQNIITNRLFIGFTIRNTDGAELFEKLDVVSGYNIEKMLPDAFSSKEFRKLVKSKGYDELVLCGLDECGCVGATAKGAVKAGLKVSIIEESTGRRFPQSKVDAMRKTLREMGVAYI